MTKRFRIYPTASQTKQMQRHCADARYVWNLGLQQRNYWNRERAFRGLDSLTFVDQCRFLTEARYYSWLAEGSRIVQVQALRDLEQAFKNWWSNPGHFGKPKWRKAGRSEGFKVTPISIQKLNRKWAEVRVPKAGYVKFRLTRPFSELETAKSANINMDRTGKWWVSFPSPQPAVERQATGSVVGIDMGVTNTLTTSNDEHLDIPKPKNERHKKHLQRKMARQVNGSNRREKTRRSIAKISARDQDARKDWVEKVTTQLVRDHDLIVLEDLKITNMTKKGRRKRGLNRSIQESCWGEFRTRLQQKALAATSSCEVVLVDPRFTSQMCNSCKTIDKNNRKNQASFCCTSCGHEAHADVNAARNILAAGLAVSGRGGDVRLLSSSSPSETSTIPNGRP